MDFLIELTFEGEDNSSQKVLGVSTCESSAQQLQYVGGTQIFSFILTLAKVFGPSPGLGELLTQ